MHTQAKHHHNFFCLHNYNYVFQILFSLRHLFPLRACVYVHMPQCLFTPKCAQVYVLASASVSMWMCVGPAV